ncbi:MAG: hypothetical protein ABJE95_28745, partial [Byssovorax sp.]
MSTGASCVALDWNFQGTSSTSSGAGGDAASGTSASATSGTGGTSGATTSAATTGSGGSGGGTGCAPGLTLCGSSCVSTDSDPSNCGECGHGCQGQGCTASVCKAVTLVAGQDSPWGLAVDSTSAYWLSVGGQAVIKMPIGGGAAAPLYPGQPNTLVGNLQGIAVDKSYVYWTDYSNNL